MIKMLSDHLRVDQAILTGIYPLKSCQIELLCIAICCIVKEYIRSILLSKLLWFLWFFAELFLVLIHHFSIWWIWAVYYLPTAVSSSFQFFPCQTCASNESWFFHVLLLMFARPSGYILLASLLVSSPVALGFLLVVSNDWFCYKCCCL